MYRDKGFLSVIASPRFWGIRVGGEEIIQNDRDVVGSGRE